MRITQTASVLAFSLLTLTGQTRAEILNFTVDIDGAQADACIGTGSTGTGSGTFTLDTITGQVDYVITFSGLLGTETASHVHGAIADCANAGVLYAVPNGTPKIGSEILSAQQMQDMIDGLHYVNIHSDRDPTGEIRGQIYFVPPTEAFGLPHTALGQASLVFDGATGHLVVSNIGSSGEDGVSIDTGPSQGFSATVDFGPSVVLPLGFEWTMSEVCDGVDPALVLCGSSFRIAEFNSGNGLLSQDLTTLGFTPESIDVIVYQDDVEVARVTHVAPFPASIAEAAFGSSPGGQMTFEKFRWSTSFNHFSRSLPHYTTFEGIRHDFMGLGVYTAIKITGGPTVQGNRIDVINRAVTTVEGSWSTGIRITQSGSPIMVLGAEGLLFDGISHTASGQARLRGALIVQVPHPRVSNIGSSGLDGVIIRPRPYGLPNQVHMEPRAIALTLESDVPGGGIVQRYWWKAKATGAIAGGDDSISSVSLDFDGVHYGWTVTPPSPWLDVYSINVRVLFKELENGFGNDLEAGIVATSLVPLVADTYEFELLVDAGGNPTGVVHRLMWDVPHDINIAGVGTFVGDTIETEIVSLSLRSGVSVDFELDSLEFLVTSTSGEVAVDILDEVVTWVDTCPADLDSNDAVDVLDLLLVLTTWGPCPGCPADTDGNGSVDVLDLLNVLTSWGACP